MQQLQLQHAHEVHVSQLAAIAHAGGHQIGKYEGLSMHATLEPQAIDARPETLRSDALSEPITHYNQCELRNKHKKKKKRKKKITHYRQTAAR